MPVLFFGINSTDLLHPSATMNPRRIPLLLIVVAGAAQADTLYKCTDSAGHTAYTNQKAGNKSCTVLSQDKPISTFAPPKMRPNTPTPDGFPRVSSEAQKNRDSDRRRILNDELTSEQRQLDDAKKALAEQEATRADGEHLANGRENYQRVLDRLKPFQDSVQLHERNIDALQREIGNQR
jgi:hypothetical protein